MNETTHVPKIIGADCELANFYAGVHSAEGTGPQASRALLREVHGLPLRREPLYAHASNQRGFEPMDWGRKFLFNGSCVYVDMDHLEICIPEVRSALDYVAAFHAMLRIADGARHRANQELRAGVSLEVLANTSDGQGQSFGSHMNFSITRAAWNNLFQRKMHHLLWLASYQVTSILFAGAGKVGAEHGAPAAGFQLSQRADFFEQATSLDTTAHRGLVNQRDEPLAGSAKGVARLHSIFYDTNLCHTALFLKAGAMQIILAMLEEEMVETELILEDPLSAIEQISRDLKLDGEVKTQSGKPVTALGHQRMFLDRAAKFVNAGRCEGIVPDAPRVIAMWADTLERMEKQDWPVLARRLDWARKLSLLLGMMGEQRGLTFTSPEVRYADLQYANVDRTKGLYYKCEAGGGVDTLVDNARIEQMISEPPEDTRAWTRAMLLRQALPDTVHLVDWDAISFHMKEQNGRNYRAYTRRFTMDEPWLHTKQSNGDAFRAGAPLDEVLDTIEGIEPPARGFGIFNSKQKGEKKRDELQRA
jgi:proteasome accessory factor A